MQIIIPLSVFFIINCYLTETDTDKQKDKTETRLWLVRAQLTAITGLSNIRKIAVLTA